MRSSLAYREERRAAACAVRRRHMRVAGCLCLRPLRSHAGMSARLRAAGIGYCRRLAAPFLDSAPRTVWRAIVRGCDVKLLRQYLGAKGKSSPVNLSGRSRLVRRRLRNVINVSRDINTYRVARCVSRRVVVTLVNGVRNGVRKDSAGGWAGVASHALSPSTRTHARTTQRRRHADFPARKLHWRHHMRRCRCAAAFRTLFLLGRHAGMRLRGRRGGGSGVCPPARKISFASARGEEIKPIASPKSTRRATQRKQRRTTSLRHRAAALRAQKKCACA